MLTNAEQRQLRVIIGQIYADYIEQLHTRYPKLNEDDVLLLCLQLADLSPLPSLYALVIMMHRL